MSWGKFQKKVQEKDEFLHWPVWIMGRKRGDLIRKFQPSGWSKIWDCELDKTEFINRRWCLFCDQQFLQARAFLQPWSRIAEPSYWRSAWFVQAPKVDMTQHWLTVSHYQLKFFRNVSWAIICSRTLQTMKYVRKVHAGALKRPSILFWQSPRKSVISFVRVLLRERQDVCVSLHDGAKKKKKTMRKRETTGSECWRFCARSSAKSVSKYWYSWRARLEQAQMSRSRRECCPCRTTYISLHAFIPTPPRKHSISCDRRKILSPDVLSKGNPQAHCANFIVSAQTHKF